MTGRRTFYLGSLLGTVLAVVSFQFATDSASQAAEPESSATEPVEESMHELMEYVFQPTYRRLRQSMEKASEGNADWKAIKSDALILAEGCNLLPGRGPAEEAVAWNEHVVATRAAGAMLYQAGKAKDADAAAGHYKSMLARCNACHDEFADGKHQLSP